MKQEKLIRSIQSTLSHNIETYGEYNHMFFSLNDKKFCVLFDKDYTINYLINQDERGEYIFNTKINWKNNEFINVETNSLLPKCIEKELSINDFLELFN